MVEHKNPTGNAYEVTPDNVLSFYGSDITRDDLANEIADIINRVYDIDDARADIIAWLECHRL